MLRIDDRCNSTDKKSVEDESRPYEVFKCRLLVFSTFQATIAHFKK